MSETAALQQQLSEIAETTSKALQASKDKSEERFKAWEQRSADAIEKYNKMQDEYSQLKSEFEQLQKRLVRPSGSAANNEQYEEIKIEYAQEISEILHQGQIINGFKMQKCNVETNQELTNKYLDAFIADKYKHVKKKYHPKIKKDMVEGSDPQGGYWIIPERSSRTISKIFETSPMRDLASVMNTSVDVLQMIIDDQLPDTGGWVGETQARPVTDTAQIGLLDIPIYEDYANVRATQRIIDDVSFNLADWLDMKTQTQLNRDQNTAFVIGDGSKKPTGILNYPAWTGSSVVIGDDDNYERGALEYIISGLDAEPTYNGLVNTQNALLEEYQSNATWMMHRTTWGYILRLTSTTDFPLIDPQSMLREGAPMILLGRPVRFGSDVPVAASDSKSIIYGDFREGYSIVDRIGYRTIRDNVTEKGYVLYYTTVRVGGALSNYQSLKVNIFSAAAGPVSAGVPMLMSKNRKLALSKAEKAKAISIAQAEIDKEVKKIKDGRKSTK